MERPHHRLQPALGAAIALLLIAAPARADTPPADPLPIVVADLDYTDTSGEARDQRAEHAARLQAFAGAIRADLARTGKYRVLTFVCSSDPCSGRETNPAVLIDDARKSGARLMLYGGIHKMSTLVQFAKIQMLDLHTGQVVFDRLITFRGDTDEAWQRAEQFVARELTQ
jgi:Protein of unknown function (DUF2380)